MPESRDAEARGPALARSADGEPVQTIIGKHFCVAYFGEPDATDVASRCAPRAFRFDGRRLRPALVMLGFTTGAVPDAELPANVRGFLDFLIDKVVERCIEAT